jgi:hypothetical protein
VLGVRGSVNTSIVDERMRIKSATSFAGEIVLAFGWREGVARCHGREVESGARKA